MFFSVVNNRGKLRGESGGVGAEQRRQRARGQGWKVARCVHKVLDEIAMPFAKYFG